MSLQTKSATSSPSSLSGVESISDVESSGVGDRTTVPDMLGNPEDTLFDIGDGDLRLMVRSLFMIHLHTNTPSISSMASR